MGNDAQALYQPVLSCAAACDHRPLASSWQQRKAAQRVAREAQARQKEELFRAAMEVSEHEGGCVGLYLQSSHAHALAG